ncbi:zinc finger, CCHC-type [Artemisia annua]|uniref:Zinc finger, CCHC-type n=1 Tax=Artemisia annua TaxID=35608 RepID=A0A2U1Q9E9_ARTAN|nr:zinc finger, CCHC-type [Artemisia annua]
MSGGDTSAPVVDSVVAPSSVDIGQSMDVDPADDVANNTDPTTTTVQEPSTAAPLGEDPPIFMYGGTFGVSDAAPTTDLQGVSAPCESQELYDTQMQLNACKMEDGQSVSSHVLKMKSFIDKLEHLGHPMPHVLAVNTIFGWIRLHARMDKTIRELHVMLKTAEMNVSSKSIVPRLHMIRDGGVKKKSSKKRKGNFERKKVPPPPKKRV